MSLTLDGTNGLILPSALGTASGGTGLTVYTANGIIYASSTSTLATSSSLTFDGTNFKVNNTALATTGKAIAMSLVFGG
jgi:hypothetical protein